MINKRIEEIKLHGIRELFEMADETTINLGQGQPDFQPPSDVIEEVHRAMLQGKNRYGSHFGLMELREEIARDQSRYGTPLTFENVLVTVGATEGLKIALEGTVDKGDEVLCPEPGFVVFQPHVRFARGKPIPYTLRKDNGFVPEIEELEERRTDRTKALIVNTPANPTGAVIPEKRIREISGWAREHGILVISDEVYDRFVYHGEHRSFLKHCDDLVVVNSFSKSYAMTGWRVGFMIARADWIRTLATLHSYTVACPPTPVQHGVLYAMRRKSDFVHNMVNEFRERRDYMVSRLRQITGFHCGTPKGAFYVFPSFDLDITSRDLALELLKEGVLTAPGSAFGAAGESHLRLSYANSMDNIRKGMDILERVSGELFE